MNYGKKRNDDLRRACPQDSGWNNGVGIVTCGRGGGATPFAYISNTFSNDVYVIDTATNTVTATVNVGSHPWGVAVNPAGTRVYVTNEGSNNVSVIDTATNTVTATVNVGNYPGGVAVNPAGTKVYVANNAGIVSVIDTAMNTVTATVNVGGIDDGGVAVNPAGTKVYVAYNNTVSVIDTATNTVTVIIVNLGSGPGGIVVNPAGTKVYMTSDMEIGSDIVSVIDTATNTVTATVNVGSVPRGVAVNPAGTKVYVSNNDNGTVSVIDTATNTVTATVSVGISPRGVAVNPAGTKVYVANKGSNNVSVIDTATNTVTATVNVGNHPRSFGQFIGPAASSTPTATQISSCTNITSPGTYVLTQNIINSTADDACIKITSSDVKFDGAGYTIDGVDTPFNDGIAVHFNESLTNVTVKNVTLTDWDYGIIYKNVSNGKIANVIPSSNSKGIVLKFSSSNNITDNTANLNDIGIDIRSSSNNTLNDNTANSNYRNGIIISSSNNNTLISNTANLNNHNGIKLDSSSYNMLTGNTVFDNYNNSISIEDSSNNTVTNNIANGAVCGISVCHSNGNTLRDNTVNWNNAGIFIANSSNGNIVVGNEVNSNNLNRPWQNRFVIFTGIYLHTSDNNVLRENNISNNSYSGIHVNSSSNNDIYNNFFDNNNNFNITGTVSNNWNTTKTSGTNIIGGSYLGGNFWANPSGTGFSQTCTDANSDGICDSPYTLATDNIDYLPLAYKPTIGLTITSLTPSVGIINTHTNVVITGSGFKSGALVTVGNVSATAVVVVSTTKITATIPTLSAGTYNVVVTNTDGLSATLTNGFTVSASSGFFDNIESGTNGWVATGFWHREYKPDQYFVKYPDINPTLVTLPDTGSLPAAYSGNYVWWYGENSTGTFIGSDYTSVTQTAKNGGTSNGAKNGTLTSPAINLASVTNATLSFMTWWEIEGVDSNAFDMMFVEISKDNGATFTELGSLNPLNDVDGASYMPYSSGGLALPGQWYKVTMDISNYTGSSQVKVRFRFNTIDPLYNGFRGWLVDDVSIGLLGANPPSIVVIAPDTGPVGSIFTIGGTGFDKGSVVTVGGVTAVSTTTSDTIIQAFVPSISTGTYDVKVTNPNGQSATVTNGFTVTTTQPPTVTAISPSTGVFGTSVNVIITGSNFITGATAKMGTKSLTNVSVVSSTTITGTIGITTPLTTGSHKVTVTNPDGQFGEKVGAFTVTGAPALVAAIAPSSRVAQVGSSVTLLVSVINYGSEYAQGVQLTQHTSLPVTITFKTWDSLTNFGALNAKATIKPNNGVAFFVLEITPTSAFSASSMTFDIKTTNGTIVSAPITKVNTFTLAATSSPSADIVMISTTTDVSASVNVPGAFAIATSNVGNAAATNVSLVVDAGTMPLVVQGKQTNPTTGAIIGDAKNIAIGVGEQPTFAVFYTPTGAIANDPGNNRINIKLVDGSGNILGSQSVAIHT